VQTTGGSTGYNLNISTGNWYSRNLEDENIIRQATDLGADGELSRTDMMTILRATYDGQVIDATEVSDLRKLVRDRGYLIPEYVRNLTNKVVNGDLANSHSGIGNLFAGSHANQMENLIGKWFLGTDRPDAHTGTYRYASGSLFQNGIDFTDVTQGNLGDCYFLAGLATVAQRMPSRISQMFIDNGDGTFTVRFYNNGVADYVTVDRYLPTFDDGSAVYARWGGGSYGESDNELWVALAEKAYAQINESGWLRPWTPPAQSNSYLAIEYGSGLVAIEQATGLNVDEHFLPGSSTERADLIAVENAGKAIVLGSKAPVPSGSSVISNHVYVLVDYNSSTQLFNLYEPYGDSIDLSWQGILDNFFVWEATA
jgi:hypothetical protein